MVTLNQDVLKHLSGVFPTITQLFELSKYYWLDFCYFLVLVLFFFLLTVLCELK